MFAPADLTTPGRSALRPASSTATAIRSDLSPPSTAAPNRSGGSASAIASPGGNGVVSPAAAASGPAAVKLAILTVGMGSPPRESAREEGGESGGAEGAGEEGGDGFGEGEDAEIVAVAPVLPPVDLRPKLPPPPPPTRVYVRVPLMRSLCLRNLTNLDARFQWAPKSSSAFTMSLTPASGVLGPKGSVPCEFRFEASEPGPLDLLLLCFIEGVELPLTVRFVAMVQDIQVAFSNHRVLRFR
jgi:hypothetical protein